MSVPSRAGATCLVLGPLLGVVSMLLTPTVSHQAADQAVAAVAHPSATQLSLGLDTLAAVLLTGGLIWLAWMTYERSPRLAIAGGVLSVLGAFAIVVDNAVHLTGAIVVDGMGVSQATDLLGPVYSGGVVSAGPLSEIADLGVILLAVAALRLGVPRWATAIICIGVLAEGAAFAIGTRYLAAIGFALACAGFATVVRTTLAGRAATEPVIAAQHA